MVMIQRHTTALSRKAVKRYVLQKLWLSDVYILLKYINWVVLEKKTIEI